MFWFSVLLLVYLSWLNVIKIYIEDSLSGFMRGRTSQQTIIKLAKFNAVLTYCLEFAYGEIIDGVNPMTARKHLFGKARVKGVSAKDFVMKDLLLFKKRLAKQKIRLRV